MPEKLFARRPSRRGRLVVMAIASLLVHAGLVGVAALRPQFKSWEIPPETTDVNLVEAEPVQELILPLDTPPPEETPPEPTPPPDDTPEPDTPPPSEEPDMTDIATPTPTPSNKPKARPTPPPAGAKRGPQPQAGVVGGVPSAAKTAGTPGGSKGGGSWKTPRPPYPYQARASRVQGSGSVRVTTDGSGRVSSASIVQSVGSGILDANTTSFARSNWSGPPNSSTTVPITYRLQ